MDSSRKRFSLLCLYNPDLYLHLRKQASAISVRRNGNGIVAHRIVPRAVGRSTYGRGGADRNADLAVRKSVHSNFGER
jgi:hypothetical protein